MNYNYIDVKFKDKLGNIFILLGEINQTIKDFLYNNRIPSNAVVVKRNGEFVSEDIEIKEGDEIFIEMVRGYDLSYFREIKTEIEEVENPIYTKRMLWFKEGQVTQRIKQFTKENFIKYFERVFLEGIKEENLIAEDDRVAFGFSGGKDSLSFLLLFQKLKRQLPNFEIIPYTVADILTEDLPSFQYAKKLCQEFGLKQRIIQPNEIEKVFHLNKPIIDIAKTLVQGESKMYTIFMLHHVMRRMIEYTAEEYKINKIILGLNLEDVLSGLISAYTTGYLIAPLPARKIGNFTYIFPLWKLTKKEIHLYVNLIAKPYSGQEPPGLWDLVPLDRGFYYAFSDYIQDIWPGIEYHLFTGFKRLSVLYKEKMKFHKCKNCGATILLQNVEKPEYCDVCQLFKKFGFLKTS